MRQTTIRKATAVTAALIAMSAALAGCSSSNNQAADTTATGGAATSAAGGADAPVTITIGTFNNFGYDAPTATLQGADLYNKYMQLHPNVTIKATVAGLSDEARSAFNTALGTGSGAYDIQAVDVDWMPSMMDNADKLVDLSNVITDASTRWQPWKTKIATTADGKLIGAGTDIGPEAICYRADLFEKAGLPTDRTEVAKLLTGGWDQYFKIGDQFMAANTGAYWFDSNAATFQGMINQVEKSYVDPATGNVIATTNEQIKTLYDQLTTAGATQSAGLGEWSDDWTAGFKNDSFATMLCPAWIINNIKNAAGTDFKGWDIADVFPGGGGNWGGSYLVIPKQSKNIEAAEALVDWLTQADQQVAVFTAASNYPSNVQAQKDPGVTGKTEPFLNNAPVGQIFANRAAAVTVVPYKGSSFFDIQTAMGNALNRVDVDKSMSAADSWNQWISDVNALG